MSKVLLSIKPVYADKIFSGEKKWEYRKKIWQQKEFESGDRTACEPEINKVVVYTSSPVKKVTGEFTASMIYYMYRPLMWWKTGLDGGVTFKEFKEYFKNNILGYAIEIKNPVLYDIPKDLSDYGIKRPPQNFMYLED